MRAQDLPEALDVVVQHVASAAQRGGGTYRVGQRWTKFSEEWYWERLVEKKPFRSVFAEEPNSRQPLVSARSENISQTPREQCELEGLVREGLDGAGPGQEVELHGLKGCPELNGRRGRVLPPSGPGAPKSSPQAGRVPVRLAGDGREVAVRPENLCSPHAAAGTVAAAGAYPASGASASHHQQQQASPRIAEMLRLLDDEFSKWQTGACLTPDTLQSAGLQQQHIRCGKCARGGQQVERYVALKRTSLLRVAPLPGSALRLLCLDCYAEGAVAARLPLTDEAVEEYVDGTMMGAMEACMQLSGAPRRQWGGVDIPSGALY